MTISKGELVKLHANYAGEKTFAKKDVVEALKSVEALKVLPAARRAEIANEIWKGYNQRLHQQGFEMFTELAWHELHAEVMQETSFEMSEDSIRAMDEQIVAALHQIVASGKPSIKAKLESATSTEGYRKQAEFWREEHGRATARHKKLNSLKYELENLANQKKGRYVNAANYRGDSFIKRLPCVKGADAASCRRQVTCSPRGELAQAAEGLFYDEISLLQSLRLASQATSLYTREAYHRPTVNRKGLTHYTMQQGV